MRRFFFGSVGLGVVGREEVVGSLGRKGTVKCTDCAFRG